MNRSEAMKTVDVLILAPDAPDYLAFLPGLQDAVGTLSAARTAGEALGDTGGVDIILGQPDMTAEYLEARPGVGWVQSTWAGVTPLLALDHGDFLLTGIKDTFGPQISEYVFGYLLAHELKMLERLGHQAHRHWWPEPSGSLGGKTMGVMGCGSIGSHVADMAGRFGMRVVGLSRCGKPARGFDAVYPAADLHSFLPVADYLVCALPETPETTGLLDAPAFAAVKPGCFLVNVGRGSLVDEKALLAALEDGRLAGAALDVFSEEPLPGSSPLWHAKNTLLTAHVAAKSRPADIAAIFLENFERYRRGETLNYRIDFDAGY